MIDPIHLLKEALQTSANAYAPYSEYRVGAAVLCKNDIVFTGCNVENASYSMTVCAERSAIASAIAAGHRDFKAIAIITSGEKMPYPCGACRQVLAEFCEPDIPVYIARAEQLNESFSSTTLNELLPYAFHLKDA